MNPDVVKEIEKFVESQVENGTLKVTYSYHYPPGNSYQTTVTTLGVIICSLLALTLLIPAIFYTESRVFILENVIGKSCEIQDGNIFCK